MILASSTTAPRLSVLSWLAPALFAAFTSVVVRAHSWSPLATLPELVAAIAVVSILMLAGMWWRGSRVSVPRDIAIVLMATAASTAVSLLLSPDLRLAWPRLILYGALGAFAMAIYLLHREAPQIPYKLYSLAIAAVHVPFLLEVIQWEIAAEGVSMDHGVRVANFSNIRQYGEFAFFAAASGSAMLVLWRKTALLAFVLTGGALFGIIATGCRGAMLSWLIFNALLVCFSPQRSRVLLHGALVLVSTGMLVWYLDRSGILETPNLFGRLQEYSLELGLNAYSAGRIELWYQTAIAILHHPLFGAGPEGYWLSECCSREVLQPHNFVLQFLLEFGIVGCLMFTLLAWRFVVHLGGLRRTTQLLLASDGNRTVSCLVCAYLAYSLIDGTLYHPLPMLLFALFAGLLAAGVQRARSRILAE